MAISVLEQWSGRSFSQKPPWTATRLFNVVATGSDTLTPEQATAATGLPSFNQAHPTFGFLLVDEVSVAQTLGPNAYVVRVNYSVSARGYHFPQYATLTSQPPRIQWGNQISQEVVDMDVHGNPITNSAGDPIPNATRPFVQKTLRIWRYEAGYNIGTAAAFENTINSAAVTLAGIEIPAGCIKCDSILPLDEYDADAVILRIGYNFTVKLNGDSDSYGVKPFQWRFLDAGKRAYKAVGETNFIGELVGALGQTTTDVRLNGYGVPIQDGWKVEGSDAVSVPSPLGATLEVSPAGADPGDETAVFLRYDKFRETDFTTLGFFEAVTP